MEMILPAIIGFILNVGLFAIEPAADKKGFGKLVSVIRTAVFLGIVVGYGFYWILHR